MQPTNPRMDAGSNTGTISTSPASTVTKEQKKILSRFAQLRFAEVNDPQSAGGGVTPSSQKVRQLVRFFSSKELNESGSGASSTDGNATVLPPLELAPLSSESSDEGEESNSGSDDDSGSVVDFDSFCVTSANGNGERGNMPIDLTNLKVESDADHELSKIYYNLMANGDMLWIWAKKPSDGEDHLLNIDIPERSLYIMQMDENAEPIMTPVTRNLLTYLIQKKGMQMTDDLQRMLGSSTWEKVIRPPQKSSIFRRIMQAVSKVATAVFNAIKTVVNTVTFSLFGRNIFAEQQKVPDLRSEIKKSKKK